MRLTVFGASGKTGKIIVRLALEAGHTVNAFVRDKARLSIVHQRIDFTIGSAEDEDSVASAVQGAGAVISAVAAGGGTLTALARNLVPAMQRHRVQRVVSLVGAGVADTGDRSSLGRKLMLGAMELVARDILNDATEHAKLVKDTQLDWTLVRPPRLTDGPMTGKTVEGARLSLGPIDSISRNDLAAFMLRVAVSRDYVRQSPMVANAR